MKKPNDLGSKSSSQTTPESESPVNHRRALAYEKARWKRERRSFIGGSDARILRTSRACSSSGRKSGARSGARRGSKAGAISFDVLETESAHAPVQWAPGRPVVANPVFLGAPFSNEHRDPAARHS